MMFFSESVSHFYVELVVMRPGYGYWNEEKRINRVNVCHISREENSKPCHFSVTLSVSLKNLYF
jgi:hypothetical protein